MKKKFQFILSLSIFLLVLSGSMIFSLSVKKFISHEITRQIVMDNQIIGSEIINYLSQQIDTSDTAEMLNSLQDICEELMLPNGGFICVMDEKGKLLAAPGINKMEDPNLNIVEFKEFESNKALLKTDLTKRNPLKGVLNYMNGDKTDIIASLALGSSELRLNVHQNMDAALENTKRFFKGFLPLAIVIALGFSLLGFVLVDRIIKGYESRIEKQAVIIQAKNKDLMSSMRYASFLQNSYLPGKEKLSEILPNSFVILKPRDIVSGDFFYIRETPENKYFAVIDCTGHGVPGSLLSMIGFGLLEQAILTLKNPKTSEVLEYLCKKFPEALGGNTGKTDTDGLDMGICAISKKTGLISYSGAKNPLFLIRDKEVIKYPGDKFSIGQNAEKQNDCFTISTIEPRKNDMLYLISDGILDQFGGPQGKKFMVKNFKLLLSEIAGFSLEKQNEILEKTIVEWKGELPQTDDISILGVRI